MRREQSLHAKFATLFVVLFVVMAAILITWFGVTQYNRAIDEQVDKARALTQELDAVWEFIDLNQELIDTDAEGNYEYKGLHCAIAGKSVAKIFSMNSDCMVRYVNTKSRTGSSDADAYEAEAIDLFKADPTVGAVYKVEEYGEKTVLRYIQAIEIEESCLDCHGEPAGEIDVTGYPKEGLAVGDISGAISIVMPIDEYLYSIRVNLVASTAFVLGMLVVSLLIIFFAIKRLVTKPINRLNDAVGKVSEREFSSSDAELHATTLEISELMRHFSEMADLLDDSYRDLEGKVETRTSELRLANEELRVSREELMRLNEDLRRANDLIKQESARKTQFFSYMTHELRTPLTAILVFIDIWEKEVKRGNLIDEESFSEIRVNARKLLSMVNNNLTLSKLESGYVELSPEFTDVRELLEVSRMATLPLFVEKGVEVTVSVDPATPLVELDQARIQMVLENLLSNAAKCTEPGGRVSLHAQPEPVDEERSADERRILIQVSDSGCGMDEKAKASVFELFVQADVSSRTRYPGGGIGLTLCKGLVELHGGQISVESVEGEGSVFSVLLPVRARRVGVRFASGEDVEETSDQEGSS